MIIVYNYVFERMISDYYREIGNLKNISSDKFISIDKCLELKNESFFILGILAKYLENIGISVKITTDDSLNKDIIEYNKNIFQFICNSYILKNKYLLDFDLAESRIKCLLTNDNERSNFNEKLKNSLMKIYNLNREEIFINSLKRYEKKFTALVVIKSNFSGDIIKDELIKVFCQDQELKTLSKIDKELIIPTIKLSPSMLYPKENTKDDRQWSRGQKRGGEDYIPPFGWIKYGIYILHSFGDNNYDWISQKHNKGEWSVAYCGITGIKQKMVQSFEHDNDIRHPGKTVGVGVICPSVPEKMGEYTEIINANGENYKVGFMVRVKPDKIRSSQMNHKIWVVNGNDDELRPYGILIKKI